MTWRNDASRYGWLSSGLHWLMLLLIAAVFASMELRGIFPKGSTSRAAMKSWHYLLGMSVLVLAAARLLLHLAGPVPAITPAPSPWQARAAQLMKVALYLFMFAMPLLGWMLVSAEGIHVGLGGLELPMLFDKNEDLAEALEEIHEAGATVGYVLIGLHAAASLYHHYLLRDDTLRRMLPWRASH